MEPGRDSAPPVVAVMVVHLPDLGTVPHDDAARATGEHAWFDAVLEGVARQDYANLRALFLVVGAPGSLPDRIRAAVPHAFVRAVDGNPGFGAVANEVLHLVEGDNGFFCFLHDDVALEPDAIRLLVEELYRSNAGIVGPKLVEWDTPNLLQHVGFGVDRFGEIDPIVEHGEVDQEQHDAVRDVFSLPSACLLVRADLFRSLGGFDPQISFHGEDLELCWRAHRGGARVVVVPSARARHRERLVERRPDLPHEALRARHRMRAVATLSSARRLPMLSIELTLLTIAELFVGVLTGSARRGVAGIRALVGLLPRTFSTFARRRALAPQRHVPDREVIGLQVRGSARLATYLRSRDTRPDAFRSEQRSWRERAGASGVIAWAALIVVLVVGSRELITDGVPPFGQFLPYPDDAGTLMRQATSAWWPHGGGATTSAPTGAALIAVSGVFTLFNMGLLHTLGVIGLLVVGPLGIWRLSAAFSTNRSRIVTLAVYAAVPLPAQLLSMGRWSALACYAAMPWFVDGLRRLAGLSVGEGAGDDERVIALSKMAQVRLFAGTTLVVAATTAFAPGFVIIAALVALALAIATWLGGGRWMAGGRMLGAGLLACVGGVLLDLPWFGSLLGDGGWAAVVGPGPAGDRGNSVFELATFDLGHITGSMLSIALYVPVLAAPLVGRGWRFAWAVRAGVLVISFGWLAVLDDGGRLPFRLPEPGIVLAPVVVGIAVAAGCAVAAFELDVRGGSFGWRQPLGLLASAAIVVGIVPGVLALGSGRYDTPTTTMSGLLRARLLSHPDVGDYRVLWLGDERLLPAAGQPYRSGIGYALTDDRSLAVDETWATRPTSIDQDIVTALDAIAEGSTARAGRLLAPFAVRYIIIPVIDGATSTSDDIMPLPAGLRDALGDQLDLGLAFSPPNFVLYENDAWVPVRSVLSADGAEASEEAGAAAIAQTDLSGATPLMVGVDHLTAGRADVPVGTVHVAVPFDRRWVLDVDGTRIAGRPAFGATLAFDVETAGTAVLRYEQPRGRRIELLVQLAGWVIVLLVASGARLPRRRVGGRSRVVEPGAVLVLDGTRVLDPGLADASASSIASAGNDIDDALDQLGAGVTGEPAAAPDDAALPEAVEPEIVDEVER